MNSIPKNRKVTHERGCCVTVEMVSAMPLFCEYVVKQDDIGRKGPGSTYFTQSSLTTAALGEGREIVTAVINHHGDGR